MAEDDKSQVQKTASEQVPEPSADTEQTADLTPANAPALAGGEQTASEDTQQPQIPDTEQPQQPQRDTRRAPGAERRISELNTQKRELEARLRAALAATGQAPFEDRPSKPEETEEYWSQKYHSAMTDEEKINASRKWQECHDSSLVSRAEKRVMQRLQSQQQAGQIAEKLVKIHDRMPFLKQNESGLVEFDMGSPVIQKALQLATEAGQPLNNPQALVYFLSDAAFDLQGQTVMTTAAALESQKLKTAKAAAATNLERPTNLQEPESPTGVKALEKELAQLDEIAQKRFDSDINKRRLMLKQRIREARFARK